MILHHIKLKAEQQHQNPNSLPPSELKSRPKILRTPAGTQKYDFGIAKGSSTASQELSPIPKIEGQNNSNIPNDSIRNSVNEFSSSNGGINNNQKTDKEQKREKVYLNDNLELLTQVK